MVFRTPHAQDIAVIIRLARNPWADRAGGLEGCEDIDMGKPFTATELGAPGSKPLRMHGNRQPGNFAMDGVSLPPQDYRICVNGHSIQLGPPLFRLLRQLMNSRGRLLTRRQLLDSVWGNSVYIEERTLDAHIQRLRKILAPIHKTACIETVSGVGYRFREHLQLSTQESSP